MINPKVPSSDERSRREEAAARSSARSAVRSRALVAAVVCAGSFASSALAQSNAEGMATLEAVSGGVTVVRQGLSQSVASSMPLQLNDIVVIRQGRATVRFRSDGSTLRIGPDSRVQIDESAKKRDVTVFFGRIWAHVVRAQQRLTRFKSRGTIAAIRGTEISLGVAADGDETQLAVLEGHVDASNDAGTLAVAAGQSAISRKGSAPVLAIRVRPQDAVQWALYYAPVVSIDPGSLGDGAWQAGVRESISATQSGDLQKALDVLAAVDAASVQDARFFVQRASLLLAAGGADAAAKDLSRALEISPGDANALALRTIIAVANNATDDALAAGRKAVAADAKSATAHVALSYAQQAAFDLDGARQSLETAVKLDEKNALAWARLAEIRSSQGNLDDALVAAEKAAALQPNLSRTQTVLGFAHLLRLRTHEAKGAFRKAMRLDPNDPLPRLGLGLAQIRESHLDEGIKNLEVAASLDPGDAVIRSYLGKAYFEAKRKGLDEREYDVAKAADPRDPTPWFYDAIAKQTTNRPAEALQSAEKSIELNDNRAVYRSRLLLDSDQAARSASLGRVYSDLGLQDRALVEGWLSVNTDQTNFSAHRFLADSYAALPRHEIARVSELFQSQMLQPANRTSIQPRLGESNQLLASSAGPGSLSFNEFSPLFSRNGAGAQVSGLFGSNDTWSGEGVASGLYDNVSVSAGYDQFHTDGWRVNSSQEDKIASAFVQWDLTPKTSVQAEYRFRDLENGDLQQRFFRDPEWILAGFTDELRKHTARVGGRHMLSPNSILLGSFTYQDADLHTRIEDQGTFVDATAPQTSTGGEVQHLYRSRWFNLTSGVGYFRIDGEYHYLFGVVGDPTQDTDLGTVPTKFNHVNLYSYANLKPARSFTLTAGASFDHLDGDLPGNGDDQINPKIGFLWNPEESTTVRAAAFRTLKRTLVTDQTLEPTQVAGFNQFFDDSDLTRAWRYGVGIDERFSHNVFGGIEYSRRDVTVPFLDLANELQEAPWTEHFFRQYLSVIPHRWFGIHVQHIFERFERDAALTVGLSVVQTHRVPLGVTFFHPFGLSTSFTSTFWHQQGTFENPITAAFVDGSSTFWLFDAALNYRLPKRYGFLGVAASNLTDEQFRYFEVDRDNPTILPTRSVFAKLTLAVP